MVGHETIGENLDRVFLGILLEPVKISRTIRIGEEYLLATIAPLGDVMGNAGTNGSGLPRQG